MLIQGIAKTAASYQLTRSTGRFCLETRRGCFHDFLPQFLGYGVFCHVERRKPARAIRAAEPEGTSFHRQKPEGQAAGQGFDMDIFGHGGGAS
ncbi:MAG: hypothetical protein IPJ40_21330 [Saprospirales bacterium]|nr:hypothetical protein [Saprospirales bacterium]